MNIAFLFQKVIESSRIKHLFLAGCLVLPTVTHAVAVGDQAPFFQLQGLDKKTYDLRDFKDKIVFVNFWASWCAPCRKELPLLDQLQSTHEALVVLAINIDSERENAEKFVEDYNIKSLVLHDPETRVVEQFGAIAMPSSFILDGNGVVRYSHYGFNAEKDPAKWQQEISRLLPQ